MSRSKLNFIACLLYDLGFGNCFQSKTLGGTTLGFGAVTSWGSNVALMRCTGEVRLLPCEAAAAEKSLAPEMQFKEDMAVAVVAVVTSRSSYELNNLSNTDTSCNAVMRLRSVTFNVRIGVEWVVTSYTDFLESVLNLVRNFASRSVDISSMRLENPWQ